MQMLALAEGAVPVHLLTALFTKSDRNQELMKRQLSRHLIGKNSCSILIQKLPPGGGIRDYLCNVCHLAVYFGTKENLVILGLWTADDGAAMDLMERILPAGLLHYLQVLLFFII